MSQSGQEDDNHNTSGDVVATSSTIAVERETSNHEQRSLLNPNRKDSTDSSEADTPPGCMARFTNWIFLVFFKMLFRYRWLLFVLWLASLPFVGFFALGFLRATKLEFQAPNGTPAADARAAFGVNFAELSTQQQAVVLTVGPIGMILNESQCDYVKQLSFYLNATTRNDSEIGSLVEGFLGAYFLSDELISTAQVLGAEDPRTPFRSEDLSSSIIVLEYKESGSNPVPDAIRKILKDFKVQNCTAEVAAQYSSDVTGFEVMMADLNVSVEQDATKMDLIAIPLALVVFWFFLKSVRMLILPLCSMVTAILYSFALMYPVATKGFSVSSLAPTIMTSVIVAISTDYTLFLLTRFNDERKTKEVDYAIANMIYFAGHVIVTSGMTLAVCFASMMFYPTTFLQSFGSGTTIGIICAIMSNLILSPTLLLCFPNFFTGSCFKCKAIDKFLGADKGDGYESVRADENDKYGLAGRPHRLSKVLEDQRGSKWFKWVKFWDSPTRSVIIILLVLAVTLPVITCLKDFKTTTDSMELFSPDSGSIITMNKLKEKFNAGVISPYRVMIVAKNKTEGVISDSYWNVNNDFLQTMRNKSLTGNSTVLSLTDVQGQEITPDLARELLDPTADNPVAASYQYLASQLLNGNQTAALTVFMVDFDPMSRTSEKWIASVRDLLANFSHVYPEHEFYLYGGSVEVVDLVSSVMAQFPVMIAITCIIVFLIVGITFNSVVIPIRGLITIGISVGWTFGAAVLFFEDWNSIPLFWLVPVFTFSVVVGLGLDYDIFLLSRIHEYRDAGFTTNSAIVKGTSETGSIITGAGTIMIIAFLSLSVSHVQVIAQMSFILSAAVFLDTFVVRTAMVPAMMRLCGWANWWPSKFGSQKAEKVSGKYGDDYFLDEEGEEQDEATLEGEEEGSRFVRPHDLRAFMARKAAIAEIIGEGSHSCSFKSGAKQQTNHRTFE
eukprot:TRINITY_DN2706_c0_g1_i1.p1 TRINITY_DN2706_c0_g1~~TRINITY_DN2706_c0_g1_i1.p1  ORF type:complete len:952 (-),score=259.45 TRINITY_DN2706_c0_g1_i1:43-2898(-)